MPEHRQFERRAFPEPVQYRFMPGDEPRGALACDYSAGGIRFRSQDFIPLNTNLYLDLSSPANDLLQLAGKVVWVQRVPHGESYQVGIQFDTPVAQNYASDTSPRFSA